MEQKRLKVIHVIGAGEFGGAEQHILQLLTLMKQHDIEAKVICFYEAGLSKALRGVGIEVEVLQYGRFDLRLTKGLREIFLREKPDIIHTHGVKANFFVRLAARKLSSVSLVTTVHSILKFDYTGRMSYFFASLMEKATRRYNSGFIAVSGAIEQSLIEDGIPSDQISVVYHGIDTERFKSGQDYLRQELSLSEDDYIIGVVTRLVEIKGIKYMIGAMPQILQANPRARLIILGSGPEEESLRKLTEQLGLQEHILFIGFRQDIAECMRSFNCLVSASLSEGLGLNVLEAMSTSVPVVVTGVGGILDFVVDHENGLLVKPRSSEDIAQKVIELMQNPELSRKLIEEARKRVVRDFSLEQMSTKTVEVYNMLSKLNGQSLDHPRDLQTKRLIISGYYGYGNSGDEAVLHSILLALREEAEKQSISIDPVVLSINPESTKRMHGVKSVHRLKIRQIMGCIRSSDGLISGGGSMLQDTTGLWTIPYYLGVIKLAEWLGKPTFIYSQGLGPIRHKPYYPLIRHTFNRSQYISVRDTESIHFLRKIGVQDKSIEIVSDPVMGLPLNKFIKPQAENNKAPASVPIPVIGISVRLWHPKRKDLDLITEALKLILEQRKVHLRFLPFHPPDDIEASRYVIERLGPQYTDQISIVADAVYPQNMLERVSSCDLLIGMRLHSLIYAASYLIPMIGISYDPKIDHFLERIEMEASGSTEHLNPHQIVKEALHLLDHRTDWVESKQYLIEALKNKSQQPAQQICQYLRLKG